MPKFADRFEDLATIDGFFNNSEFLDLWGWPIRNLDFFDVTPSYHMSRFRPEASYHMSTSQSVKSDHMSFQIPVFDDRIAVPVGIRPPFLL
jgi:hypothetical protein